MTHRGGITTPFKPVVSDRSELSCGEYLVLDVPAGVGLGDARTLFTFSIGVLLAGRHPAHGADDVKPDAAVCTLNLEPGCTVGVFARADELRDRNGCLLCDELQGCSVVEHSLFVVEA